MENKKILIISLLFFVCVSCGSVSDSVSAASTIYVNSASGNDAWSGTSATHTTGSIGPKKHIQNAINVVSSGGVVNVAIGNYNEHLSISKSVTINGANRAKSIIDGTSTGRIINITGSYTVKINHVTLQNGKDKYGGAIYNKGSLSLNDCTFKNNKATDNDGGAISNDATLNINNCAFTGNSANKAGAISNFMDSCICTITKSTFTSNTASDIGGAIWGTGKLNVYNSVFTNNRAPYGGAIADEFATTTIKGSTFTSNIGGIGGAFYNTGSLNICSSTFTSNKATDTDSDDGGGAIYNDNTGALTITYTTFKSNIARQGGAIYNVHNLVIHYSQLIGNSLEEIYSGSADARYNWWGSNANPSSKVTANVDVSNWLTAPKLISSKPKNGAKKVSRTQIIAIKFNRNIKTSSAWSKITVKKNSKKISFKKWIKGNTLYIKTKKLNKKTYYYVYLPKNAVKDIYSINLSQYAFKFKTK